MNNKIKKTIQLHAKITANNKTALQQIQKKYGCTSESEAVRLAINIASGKIKVAEKELIL